jgi:hypothetical protein
MNKFWKYKCFYHGYLPKKGELSMLPALNKLFFNFIWDGKPEKIKRNTLIADYDTFTTVQCLSQNKLDKKILFQFVHPSLCKHAS